MQNADGIRYATRFKQYAGAINSALGNNVNNFQAGDLSSGGTTFDVPGIFKAGINSGGVVNLVVGRYYCQSDGNYSKSLSHTKTVTQLAESGRQAAASYCASIGLAYILSKVNLVTNPPTPVDPSFPNSLAVALWRMDFMLYTMSIGVKTLHFENEFGSFQAT